MHMSAGCSNRLTTCAHAGAHLPAAPSAGHGSRVTGLALMANMMLASVSHDRCLRIWDLRTFRAVKTVKEAHETPLQVTARVEVPCSVHPACQACTRSYSRRDAAAGRAACKPPALAAA